MFSPNFSTRILYKTFLTLFFAFLPAQIPVPCAAGGILHVFPPALEGESLAVARPEILLSKTLVTVSESEIEYRIDQTFFNNNDFPLRGIFLLPIERDADLRGADALVDGFAEKITIATPDDSFPVLRELTVGMKDPSLLGLSGKHILQVKDLTIGARKQITVFRAPRPRLSTICRQTVNATVVAEL